MSKNVVTSVMPPLWKLAGRHYNFVRIAGLSGAAAVILGAIGSHHLNAQEKPELHTIFETANRFHFFHSIALLGMPLAKYPVVVSLTVFVHVLKDFHKHFVLFLFQSGSLMVIGMSLFSGTLYYRAFTGNKPPFPRMAPIGGTCLIAAWLSLLL